MSFEFLFDIIRCLSKGDGGRFGGWFCVPVKGNYEPSHLVHPDDGRYPNKLFVWQVSVTENINKMSILNSYPWTFRTNQILVSKCHSFASFLMFQQSELCACECDSYVHNLCGIALGNGLGDRRFGSQEGLGIFIFTTASRLALRPSAPIQWVPGVLFLGVKRPGREADRSPPSSAEVKNAWSYEDVSKSFRTESIAK
jgi:hypothetical protein